MKILLVDDEQSLLEVFAETLQLSGFEVIKADSGIDAIAKAKTDNPDLILLDQIMPDMNGNDVLKILKETKETKDIPVAMLTNFTQDNMMQDAINLGASDYILKYQIDPKDLIAKVNQIMQEKGATQNAAAI